MHLSALDTEEASLSPSQTPNTNAAQTQPWERLATHGHVLFARINALRARLPSMANRAAIAVLLLPASIYFANRLHVHAAEWAQAAARLAAKPFAPTVDKPYYALAIPHATSPALTPDQTQGLHDASIVSAGLLGQLDTTIRANKPLQGCRNLKLTDAWPADAIGCRTSADKSRIWVWGLAKAGSSYSGVQLQPVFVVYRLGQWSESDSKTWELRAVDFGGMSNVRPLEGLQTTRWAAIPRAATADFAELSPVLPR